MRVRSFDWQMDQGALSRMSRACGLTGEEPYVGEAVTFPSWDVNALEPSAGLSDVRQDDRFGAKSAVGDLDSSRSNADR